MRAGQRERGVLAAGRLALAQVDDEHRREPAAERLSLVANGNAAPPRPRSAIRSQVGEQLGPVEASGGRRTARGGPPATGRARCPASSAGPGRTVTSDGTGTGEGGRPSVGRGRGLTNVDGHGILRIGHGHGVVGRVAASGRGGRPRARTSRQARAIGTAAAQTSGQPATARRAGRCPCRSPCSDRDAPTAAYADRCSTRQVRWRIRLRSRLETVTTTSRSRATAPRPSQSALVRRAERHQRVPPADVDELVDDRGDDVDDRAARTASSARLRCTAWVTNRGTRRAGRPPRASTPSTVVMREQHQGDRRRCCG